MRWLRPPGRMSSCPHHTSPKFRQRTVELARQGGKPVAQIARDLGISESRLRNWMAQADADENGSAVRTRSQISAMELDKFVRDFDISI
jgi:transposase-like protein